MCEYNIKSEIIILYYFKQFRDGGDFEKLFIAKLPVSQKSQMQLYMVSLICFALIILAVRCHGSSPVHLEERRNVPLTTRNNYTTPMDAFENKGSQHRFPLNISGTYKGTWFDSGVNSSASRFPDLKKDHGNIIFQLKSELTAEKEVHYVHGEVILRDGMYISDKDVSMRMEGVYVQLFGELRLVLSNSVEPTLSGAHLETPGTGNYPLTGLEHLHNLNSIESHDLSLSELTKSCNIRMVANLSPALWEWTNSVQEHVSSELIGRLEGLHVSSKLPCFPTLHLNATAVNLDAYYNKAINYTLMVTFISFLQVLFIIRQMEHSNTQSAAAKVSIFMVGQQAIIDSYLCLLHLTAGIVVESLFNAFATAAFFKFVIFSIFEMRYLLTIWKARRPANSGEGWELLRRELSVLYTRFYGFLLGGIVLLYHFHSMLRYILLVFYCFWIPQIVTSALQDARKPLHPHYIVGITLTRLVIPLYTFGCPRNFMRVEPSPVWCAVLCVLLLGQAAVLLLQHCFGARFFVPRQFLPEKYSYFRRPEKAMVQVDGSEEDGSELDCVICMTPVPNSPRSTQRMVTPCEHAFHTGCLQRWMDIKMECPTCRRALPPV